MLFQKQKNQGVQCSIKDSMTDVKNADEKFTKLNELSKADNLESCPKHNDQSKFKPVFFLFLNTEGLINYIIGKIKYKDMNNEFKKQMAWFHKNYMKTEKENQMHWINNQISHLNNLKKFVLHLLYSFIYIDN